MKILLTGGTGFLGKNVARRLAAHGHALRVLARGGSNLEGLPAGAETVRGDVTDGDSLRRAAAGCGALVHLAALVKSWVPDPARFEAVNVGGLTNALGAAREAGARLVYTSSFIAVGPAGPLPADETRVHPGGVFRNAYERTKARADGLAREAAAGGEDVVMLYPGVVYGPGEMTDGNLVVKMVADHLRGRFPGLIGPGDRLWSYAFVEDVAEGHALALERGGRGERYFLGGENVSLNGFFALLQEVAGVPPPRRHIPYGVASLLGHGLVLWAELTGHPPLLTHEVVNVFREHWAYSSAKAERELGYRPTPLREGLRRTVDWLRAQGVA
ncbi:MAG TPA: NAD-dependent epimerase/dehydratase family protein [Vicinamibacteria bacterium]|nr:NAD-dependent epimerase/dehydratase family protein [Vicinamibacteria bacterium]